MGRDKSIDLFLMHETRAKNNTVSMNSSGA